MKKTALTLTLILVSLFSLITLQFTALVTANPYRPYPQYLPVIYIKNDGSINPATTLIEHAGDVYTLTGNIINYSIVVQLGNTVIDGSGHTLQTNYPPGSQWGYDDAITIFDVSNVTIRNFRIEGFSKGITFSNSSYNNIIGNSITECREDPVWLLSCSYSNIAENNITGNNMNGVYLRRSDNNSIANNSIAKNGAGICLSISTNNKFVGNNDTLNAIGIVLSNASKNYFYLNNFVNNTNQLYIWTEEQVPNFWDNGEAGNFWSNYNGTDANGDGVGDSPFIVDTVEATNITLWHSATLGNQQDSFPLMALNVGQELPLPTNVPHPNNKLYSIEVYILAIALISTFIGIGLLIYFKKR